MINNTVKYNAGDGVQLMNTSRGNILERNTINNNKIGVEDASPDAVIIQNNIKNNFDIGLKISQKPNRFAFNNIYKNQNYNVGNQVYNLDATNNYWGSTDKTTIEAGFLTAATSTTATSTVSAGPANYPIIYIPFLTKETNTAAIFDPVIDSYSTSTVLTQVALTGLKPVGTDAYVNGAMIAVDNNSSTWNYNAILGLGDNSYTIYYSDSSGTRSNPLSLIIRRNNTLAAPVLNSYPTTTSSPSLVLTGTKPANTSLLINGVEVGALSAMTAWSYALPLDLGLNSVEVMAKDADGQYSAPIDFTVTRVKLSASDISAQEKIITTKVDAKLALKLAGQLLLQTENNGYIWYINPKDNKRYLVTFDNALALFKSFATGITEKNLNLIPTKESGQKGNAALRTKFKGKFLLRVEAAGQVSYVDLNGYRHDISADNLMANFRALSLGISNVNLRKITVGEVK